MKKDEYDAIIIGAGIGGLVCGCYLAKAGMKVLIVEKNDKPGGYCTSFERNGFEFDACVHSFGSCRDGGILEKILNDLQIFDKLKLKRRIVSDVIITSKHNILITDDKSTKEELQRYFPRQTEEINNFFKYIINSDNRKLFIRLQNSTLEDLLNMFFQDNILKAILSLFILGNAGLPPSLISGFMAAMIYREFMFDGGYNCEEGIQSLPNMLASIFISFGGCLSLASKANKIAMDRDKIVGIYLENNDFFSSNYLVLDCDLISSFLELFDQDESQIIKIRDFLSNFKPSLSAFCIYLGLNKKLPKSKEFSSNIWYLPKYDIENMFKIISKGELTNENIYSLLFIRNSSVKDSVCLFVNAPYINETFWQKNKNLILEGILKKQNPILDNVKKDISVIDFSTPLSLNKYTNNFQGACYGWAPTLNQVWRTDFFDNFSQINHLFITGHWNTRGHGIPFVAYSGYLASQRIIQDIKKEREA